MVILALDALESSLVEKFNCQALKQKIWGKTDISEFKLERTVILWASFLRGKNMEKDFKGNLWTFKIPPEKTFLRFFKNYRAIDLPAFNYQKAHKEEKKLLKKFFQENDSLQTIKEYGETTWKIHRKTKKEFFTALEKNYDILVGYFNLADTAGHLSFGIEEEMKTVYQELENIAQEVRDKIREKEPILIISDHGMKAIGRFGDHNKKGFFSWNKNLKMEQPKITDFYPLIKSLA